MIGGQVAALGFALGCIRAGAGAEVARAAVLAELRARGRWLLVFDNVHLTNIFAKLGITTRAELAAQAAAHDLTADDLTG